MNTILIPVDFSEGSQVSINYAIQLAGKKETTLYLFHIYPDQLMIPDSSFPTGIDSDAFLNTEFIYELRKQAEVNMESLIEEVKKLTNNSGYQNIKVESFVTGGDPEWEIKEICVKLEPSLIVMGTRGEGNKGFLEGSMAEKIMVRACRPVLAVPQITEVFRLKNIMYATTFSEKDFQNIAMIFELLTHLDIKIHIVHFNLKESKNDGAALMDALYHSMANIYKEEEFECHLIDGNEKSDVLETFIGQNNIDLISFIAHKKNIFKNLFSNKIHKKDFFKLELPMLAIHE